MKKTKIFAVTAAGVLALGSTVGLAGCGGNGGGGGGHRPNGSLGRETTIYVMLNNSTDRISAQYDNLAKTYNETIGKEDDVEVVISKEGTTADYSRLLSAKSNDYDVMTIGNMTFKQSLAGYLDGANAIVPLDDYLKDSANAELLGLSDIPETSMDMWKMTQTSDENEMFYAGAAEGAQQLALSFVNNPQVLFYNTKHFANLGINVISVPEGDLAAYNTANKTKLQPHGYAEYTLEAFGGQEALDALGFKTSENLDGKTVVKVFNDCIPMNWEELRTVAKQHQTRTGKYGYMSEWWFNYGWSVGGDCVGWNGDEYEFSVGDKTKGLLVIDDTFTVNGTTYYQGDVLDYEDLHSISDSKRAEYLENGNVAELPSMYEAFLEYNRLGVPTDKNAADGGVKGYGLAPNTTDDRVGDFSDDESAMLVEYYATANSFSKLNGNFDAAPLPQYREYVGSSYTDTTLKVIGEDGYTGELATATNSEGEEIAIVGEAVSAVEPEASGMFLPANADESRREASLKFMLWACGPEGQEILAASSSAVPNQTAAFMEDDEFLNAEGRLLDNMYGALLVNSNTYVGDWSYGSSDLWVQTWSAELNGAVRRGEKTLDAYLSGIKTAANRAIAGLNVYMKRT